MWVVLILLALAACGGPAETGDDTAVVQEQAGVRGEVRLELDATELTVADTAELALTVAAQEGWEVEWPRIEAQLEGFLILGEDETAPRLVEGGRIATTRTFVLEPELDGDYEIPALDFRLAAGDGETRQEETFSTEPVIVRVFSAIEGEDAEEAKLREIPDPESLPGGFPWWILALIVALAAAGYGYWRWRLRPRAEKPVPVEPPHVIAERALAALAEEGLTEQGQYKAYFARLSDILRQYIEGRFGLRAPEQTTEEFLQALAYAPVLVGEHKDRLRHFLELSDLVKFAKHEPRSEDADASMGACREFVRTTKIEYMPTEIEKVEAGR